MSESTLAVLLTDWAEEDWSKDLKLENGLSSVGWKVKMVGLLSMPRDDSSHYPKI